MVYASPANLNDDYNDENIVYTTLADPPTPNRPVRVYYNGTAVDSIAGPVPIVDLGKTYNRTEGGILQSITTKIGLSGKIIRSTYYDPEVNPQGTGTAILLAAIESLDDLFKCNNGVLEIKCGNVPVFTASGVKINSFSANKSNDNWLFSSDYTVDLEFSEPAYSGGPLIRSGSDSWSLEPIDEYVYTDWNMDVNQRAEYDNPLLNPSAGSSSSNATPTRVPAQDGRVNLSLVSIPQFKLSRKLSAVGIPDGGSGNCGSGDYTAYQNAQNWVKLKLAEAFGGSITNASGLPRLSPNGISALDGFSELFLYNHLRTTNFDHLAGSYEVNETWLAMPTGIKYTEDYSIESSTDDRFIKTVRIQGTIKGLMISAIPIMSGSSGLVPDSTGIISLAYSKTPGISGSSFSQQIQDKISAASNDQSLYGNKYQNALSGWLNDVKPYLYRRASLGVNSPDRNKDYINTTLATPPAAPNNPVYSYENLLNIIPVSTTEGHDPRKGSISYTYEFNNKTRFMSGVLAENISISDTGPTEIINQAFVLGRRLGPILQSLGTRTNATKSVSIDIVVLPPSSIKGFVMSERECPVWTGGTIYQTINQLVEGLRPFGARQGGVFSNVTFTRDRIEGQAYVTRDDQSWNPMEGRYTRNVDWVYQTCNLSRYYLDH
jgi:hypothetical protein